jgi:hypothetical protein
MSLFYITMRGLRKILLMAFASSCLTTGSFVLYGQSKIYKKPQIKHAVTIGFQSGKSVLFETPTAGKKAKARYFTNNSVNLNLAINKHFKAESGISYNTLPSQSYMINGLAKPSTLKYSGVSVPFTLQYYPLQHHCRLQPYCGVGFQYNNNPFNTSLSAPADNSSGENTQTGTKYISVIFAQGMTFEINTKIQITQSFHFIPEGAEKTIGFGFGIGYTIQ